MSYAKAGLSEGGRGSRAIFLRSVIPASFSGDINVAGSAGGPRRPEKMPGRNRAEGIPADGAHYGNAGPSGRLPVEMLCGHRLVRQLAPRPCHPADGRPAQTPNRTRAGEGKRVAG